jgi:hypothetical protein
MVKTMTGPLNALLAAQHVKDLLDEAERDRRHRGPREDDRWSRPTTHPLRRVDHRRRADDLAGTAATRNDTTAIDSNRPALEGSR